MAKHPVVKFSIQPGNYVKLERVAQDADLGVSEFMSNLAVLAINGVTPTMASADATAAKRVWLRADDLPTGIERGGESGFVGVKRRGKGWRAVVDDHVVGDFSSPEAAAIARHFILQGFRVGRGALHTALGETVEQAAALALTARFAPVRAEIVAEYGLGVEAAVTATPTPSPSDDEPSADAVLAYANRGRKVDIEDRQDHVERMGAVDPPRTASLRRVGPGSRGAPSPLPPDSDSLTTHDDLEGNDPSERPVFSEGPRATPANGGRAPSTSGESVARGDHESQAQRRRRRGLAACPVCGDMFDPSVPRAHALCSRCCDDYERWSKLDANDDPSHDPPADGVYTSAVLHGSKSAETFADYVRRVRAL